VTADEPEPVEPEPVDVDDQDDAGPIAPLDFNVLVLSLNASALIHLGEPDSDGRRSPPNLPMARHTIDLLCVLDEKTRGNLTGEEERLLHQVLFDLRMRFASSAGSS
jgi:hypothetical protein